jgi:hypothetical protein
VRPRTVAGLCAHAVCCCARIRDGCTSWADLARVGRDHVSWARDVGGRGIDVQLWESAAVNGVKELSKREVWYMTPHASLTRLSL